MDDRTAFLRAVTAAPDDDLPRLVFADWLDEHDEADYAAFVRAQVELARTPPWEPFAVRCRHFAADTIVRGTPWLPHLPRLRPGLEWHPDTPFRRGFAWSLVVREMPVFMIEAARLFAEAPIGQLHLPTATLDQWRWFGEQPWLSRVKSIHFYGLTLPVEPVSVLCDSPDATGLEEVVFEVSRGVAMPILVERLFRAPLGRQLQSLEFRGIDQAQDELIAAFTVGTAPPQLTRLSFQICRFTPEHVDLLANSPALDTLTELRFESTPLDPAGLGALLGSPRLSRLSRLALVGVHSQLSRLDWPTELDYLPSLRMLRLCRIWLTFMPRPTPWARMVKRLRSLDLSRTDFDDRSLRALAAEWANLTELDLSGNGLTDIGIRRLLLSKFPPDLTALVVSNNQLSHRTGDKLRRHFGDRVIL